MDNAKISVLIPAYNAANYVGDSVRSALNQTWKNIEVIVVDDGSQDKTLCVLNNISHTRLKVISQANRGAAAARNTAFKASSGDYIQYLDADDLLAENKLEEQMKLVDRFGDNYVYASSWGIFYDTIAEAQFYPTSLWIDFDSGTDWLVEAWTKQVWMQPSSWLTPRKFIEKAGIWEETLSLHDDGEFFCRVLLQSQGIKFCEQAKTYYRKGLRNSLSGTLSEKAIQSHLKVCELYEKHLLVVENSERTQQACATNYMHFHFAHYPDYKAYRDRAKESAKRLGGTGGKPRGTELFHLLNKMMGWHLARRLEKFYYKKGLNRNALKQKLFS